MFARLTRSPAKRAHSITSERPHSARKLFAHPPPPRKKHSPNPVLASISPNFLPASRAKRPNSLGGHSMVETVSTEQFTTGAIRRKPETFEFVKFNMDAGVARLTLNRPDHNLLNEAMLREIADGIIFAGERDDVKLITIDSACKVFSGGVDIGEYTAQRVYQMLEAFHAAFAGMLEVSKPVLCVVNGPAIGGGG